MQESLLPGNATQSTHSTHIQAVLPWSSQLMPFFLPTHSTHTGSSSLVLTAHAFLPSHTLHTYRQFFPGPRSSCLSSFPHTPHIQAVLPWSSQLMPFFLPTHSTHTGSSSLVLTAYAFLPSHTLHTYRQFFPGPHSLCLSSFPHTPHIQAVLPWSSQLMPFFLPTHSTHTGSSSLVLTADAFLPSHTLHTYRQFFPGPHSSCLSSFPHIPHIQAVLPWSSQLMPFFLPTHSTHTGSSSLVLIAHAFLPSHTLHTYRQFFPGPHSSCLSSFPHTPHIQAVLPWSS